MARLFQNCIFEAPSLAENLPAWYHAAMAKRKLSEIIDDTLILEKHGAGDPNILSLKYDSREAAEGVLFFALPGIHTDGHDYIPDAVRRGAAAVVHSRPLSQYKDGTIYLRVEDTRRVMSPISAEFYRHPSKELTVIGVTGTDGKSTTVSFIHQLLESAGFKAGFLSTVQFNTGGRTEKNHFRQSTPEAPEIHRILRTMREAGCTHAVVEATSHGLSKVNNRLGSVSFDIGVFTNISKEHLEFHKTFEQYLYDKANLFRSLRADRGKAVINLDDPNAPYLIDAGPERALTYSVKNPGADIFASGITDRGEGQDILLRYRGDTMQTLEFPLYLPLPGRFNVENLLAALGAVFSLPDSEPKDYIAHIHKLLPVKGRMVPVRLGQPFEVLVDYAHTPGSFEKLFPQLRERTRGRLIALFGSAGERDLEKRSCLGEIASRYSDIIVLADEDPRGEEPRAVLEAVAAGCADKQEGEDLLIIEDRGTAIRHAFSLAEKDDLVVLLGKGHEGSIIYNDGPIPWDEEQEAVKALDEMGYSGYKEE
ncbi:MAG: UDP-N-acetylmuramoyl-L-alanyl-D-glutamate--2,6-diaminopimelate ligase [Spirochaetaceae bacterium]